MKKRKRMKEEEGVFLSFRSGPIREGVIW